jgi:dTDP-4-dehydrorhamnose 3,5-epimerase-like enzyme
MLNFVNRKTTDKPYLITHQPIGDASTGYINVVENKQLPFEIKRVYWIYATPDNFIRGNHAHKTMQQVVFVINGRAEIVLEDTKGAQMQYILEEPGKGLFVPPLFWRKIKLEIGAVLLCLASEEYMENDYIRNYDDFRSYK